MRNILTITEQDITPGSPTVGNANFRKREAARAVVFDSEGRIALLRVGLHGYHKLPGGGIEEGEDIYMALERELLEELGCKALVTHELGEVIEYRSHERLFQVSYCFYAKQIGTKGEPSFTNEEIQDQFSVLWVDSIDSAIDILEKDQPTNHNGKFIQIRDLAILRESKNKITK